MELYNYRHAATALAGNRAAADVLKRKRYTGSIHVIPQFGFDTEIYRRTEVRSSRAADAPFNIGFIGRLKEEKGLPLMIEALTYLPDYCRAVFVGHGPMRNTLEEQATRLGVTDRVIFKPGVPTYEVPGEMQLLDAFVLPSLTRPNWMEQFGRVLPEAMACETPVIGSNSGEIPFVIDDAGLIFPEGDARALSEGVRKLLDDPTLYENLSRRGRQRVLDNYTQEQVARQTY